MKLLLARLRDILLHRDVEYAEFQACVLSVTWGLWMILFSPFDQPYFQLIYGRMSSYAADEYWGVVFVLLGVAQTYALITNKYTMRAVLMLFAFAWWSAIFLMQAFQLSGTLPVPTTFLFALASAWGFVRVVTEPRRRVRGTKEPAIDQPSAQPS